MRLLLAVSGGIDSMYLANRAPEFYPGASFAMAHCNFSLRDAESDADEQFVRDWCSTHDMELHSVRFDTLASAQKEGISIEMAARELRYRWFAELCAKHGYDAVVVAHNANDNAETLLLNLLRGTGSKGIRGMAACGNMYGITVLRPMLGISRAGIRQWMEEHGASWREDSSNAESQYKRNKIRNLVWPVFEQINPSFVQTLGEDMQRFSQVDEIADDYYRACGLDPDNIDIQALMGFGHWEYLLYRLTEGRLNADMLRDLCEALRGGRRIAGRSWGPYRCSNGRIALDRAEEPDWNWEVVDRISLTTLKQPPGTLILDADMMELPPRTRHWKDGDWMVPLGMRGKKKLSDLFVDLKYSIARKNAALLIPHPDGNGRIAAVIAERIDDSLKVTDKTRRVLVIRK